MNAILCAKKGGRPSKMPGIEELSEMYVNHTYKEIADHYGVSPDTVRGWVRRIRRDARSAAERGGATT